MFRRPQHPSAILGSVLLGVVFTNSESLRSTVFLLCLVSVESEIQAGREQTSTSHCLNSFAARGLML